MLKRRPNIKFQTKKTSLKHSSYLLIIHKIGNSLFNSKKWQNIYYVGKLGQGFWKKATVEILEILLLFI